MEPTRVGLEVLAENPAISKTWGNCALISNQASVTLNLTPAYRIAQDLWGQRFKALMGPQHGFWGTAQDNMIETPHGMFGNPSQAPVPVYSLYSETREPTEQMLRGIDTLVIDLQIVGCRIYTFKSTIAGCLRAAKRFGRKVVVLDRPNPIGGVYLEGRWMDPDMQSFVGPRVMPMRHGLTAAEAAQFFNEEIGADLEVVPLQNWDATRDYRYTQRPWVITSPNLPTLEPVFVYPGTVMFEGTNISEGRGTGLPFQFIGAPYIRGEWEVKGRLLDLLRPEHTEGLHFREACFEPTSGKGQQQLCRGLQIHVTDPAKVKSFIVSVALIQVFRELGGEHFAWKSPPYEYEHETLPMKIIVGSKETVEHFDAFSVDDPFWQEGLSEYREKIRPFLLYPRAMQV